MDFDPAIDFIENGGDNARFGEKMREAFKRTSTNLEDNSGLDYRMHTRVWKVVMLD